MSCPRCGANVASGENFCGDCGSPLPLTCKVCSSENPPGKKFCADCGAALTTRLPEQMGLPHQSIVSPEPNVGNLQ